MSEDKVAKYIIAFLYNKESILNINSEIKKDFIEVKYINEHNKTIDNKVKFDGQKVMWGMLNGRWRDNRLDSRISYELVANTIIVTERFVSGNSHSEIYKIME